MEIDNQFVFLSKVIFTGILFTIILLIVLIYIFELIDFLSRKILLCIYADIIDLNQSQNIAEVQLINSQQTVLIIEAPPPSYDLLTPPPKYEDWKFEK
ncbi:hypothetical protein PVAND_001741 [Polypedilum vanderplanki]|uniref:Uncharacterized protein n=1 Tax=Polypedilum vanderplanki TaxID=319348 RepID=A0A9J6BNV9_POLVA|nr:hypothetical protein PVAND_001741 [Polypedilum vanderplanki]